MILLRPFPTLLISFPSRDLKGRTAFAIEMVRELCAVAEEVRTHGGLQKAVKKDGSSVTTMDFLGTLIATQRLEGKYPGESLWSEEDGRVFGQFPSRVRKSVADAVSHFAPRAYKNRLEDWIRATPPMVGSTYWGLDPIDVTAEFIKGGAYSVNFFYVKDGVIQLGVIGVPHLSLPGSPEGNEGELLVAVQQRGAWHCGLTKGNEFRRLHVSNRRSLSEATWVRPLRDTSRRFTDQDYDLVVGCHRVFSERAASGCRAVSPVRFAWVAAGLAGFFVNFRLEGIASPFYVHDYAAGVLLVQEAGGTVTTLRRRPPDFTRPPHMGELFGMAVSNSPPDDLVLHDEVLQVFRSVAFKVFPHEKRRLLS